LERVAAEAGVNPIELKGAVNATGMSPREYLQSTGELPMPTPQPTAKPIATAAFTGRVTPRVSSVGGFQTFDFDITNDGSTDINGINLRAGGASDKYTIIGTLPSGGRVDQGIFGNKSFYWPLKVAPGQTTSVTVTLSPNEPGNHYVTFYLEDGAKLGLKSRSGSSDDVSMTVAVTR